MKSKEVGKKLNLSKETIADLDTKSMSMIKGGSLITTIICKFITETC